MRKFEECFESFVYKVRITRKKHSEYTYYNQMRVYTSNPDGLPPAVYWRLQMEKAA